VAGPISGGERAAQQPGQPLARAGQHRQQLGRGRAALDQLRAVLRGGPFGQEFADRLHWTRKLLK
jgi:hypothetical protein